MIRLFLSIIFLVKFSNPMFIEENSFFVLNEARSDEVLEITEVTSSSTSSLAFSNQEETNSQSTGIKLEEQHSTRFGRLEFLLICLGVGLLCLFICYKLRKFIKRHRSTSSKSNARSTESFYQQQIKPFPRTSTKSFNQNLSQQNYDYIEFIGL